MEQWAWLGMLYNKGLLIMSEFSLKEDVLHCAFEGALDMEETKHLSEEIVVQMEKHKPSSVVFDLQKVSYISSAFLRLCLQTYQEIDSENFSIVNLSPHVKKVFKIAGFDKEIKIQ